MVCSILVATNKCVLYYQQARQVIYSMSSNPMMSQTK